MCRISLTIHALVELMAGLALLVGAFALDLGAAGTVLTFLAGASLAGLGLGAAESLPPVCTGPSTAGSWSGCRWPR